MSQAPAVGDSLALRSSGGMVAAIIDLAAFNRPGFYESVAARPLFRDDLPDARPPGSELGFKRG